MKVDEIVAKAQAAVRSSKQRVKKSKIVKASSLKMIEETRLRKRNRLRNQAAPISPKGDYLHHILSGIYLPPLERRQDPLVTGAEL
jgi:hypothetical protein